MMQNAALLWHVSLLVPPERKGLALGLVGLVARRADRRLLDDQRRRRRRVGPPPADAGHADRGRRWSRWRWRCSTFRGLTRVWPIYVLAALGAAVGAFDLPARQALVPTLVPREHLPNAISLNTIMFQTASVAGPALGGIADRGRRRRLGLRRQRGLVRLRDRRAADDARRAGARSRPRPARATTCRWHAALEGLRFVFRSPLIRSTMLLDFFATFFSSATALLPIFAQDILHVGAAAATAGCTRRRRSARWSTSAAMVPLTERIERRGPTLLWAVARLRRWRRSVFGFSRSFWLTFACLALTGATDTVSMVIRNIIRQLETPDRLRGRMTGVNMVFFMGGPQLGELEAGAVAQLARRAVLGRSPAASAA